MPASTGIANQDLGNIAQYIQRMLDFSVPNMNTASTMLQQFAYPWSDPNSPFYQNPSLDVNALNGTLRDFQQNGVTLPQDLGNLYYSNLNGANSAQNIVNNGGVTPTSQAATNGFLSIINNPTVQAMISNGGQTGQTNTMFSQGRNLLQNNGFTDQMTQALNSINGRIQAGGWSPQALEMMKSIQGIIDNGGAGGALLPMSAAISMAQNQNATNFANASEAANRAAFQRLGAAAGAGTVGGALGEFSDQAAQSGGLALSQAAQAQQQLQLQQLLGAYGAGTNLTGQANSLLASLYNNQGDLFKSASTNMATGAGLENNATSTASSNLATALGGVNNASSGLGSVANSQNNAVSNALQAIASLNTSNANMYNNYAQNYLEGLKQQGTNINNFTQNWLNAAGQNAGIGATYLGVLPSLFDGYSGVSGAQVNNANTPGFWQSLFGGLVGTGVGGAAGGIGTGIGNKIGKAI